MAVLLLCVQGSGFITEGQWICFGLLTVTLWRVGAVLLIFHTIIHFLHFSMRGDCELRAFVWPQTLSWGETSSFQFQKSWSEVVQASGHPEIMKKSSDQCNSVKKASVSLTFVCVHYINETKMNGQGLRRTRMWGFFLNHRKGEKNHLDVRETDFFNMRHIQTLNSETFVLHFKMLLQIIEWLYFNMWTNNDRTQCHSKLLHSSSFKYSRHLQHRNTHGQW